MEAILDALAGNAAMAILTWVGTILGLIGLWLTYRQALSANQAAKASQSAIESTLNKVALGTSAYSGAQIDMVKRLIQDSHSQSAEMIFQTLKRPLMEVIVISEQVEEMKISATNTRKSMRIVELQLRLMLEDNSLGQKQNSALSINQRKSVNIPDKNKLLSELTKIGDFLLESESKIRNGAV